MRTPWSLVALVLVVGCEKSKATPGTVAAKKEQKASGKAEVEFFGSWETGGVKAEKVMFVAQLEPCAPVPDKPTRLGEQVLETPGPLFAEFFIAQGTTGHACVYGFDGSGTVVGVAGSTQNPMRFEGAGEIIFGRLGYTLAAP